MLTSNLHQCQSEHAVSWKMYKYKLTSLLYPITESYIKPQNVLSNVDWKKNTQPNRDVNMSTCYISIQTLLTTFSVNNMFLCIGVIYYLTSNWLFALSCIKCLMILYSIMQKDLIFGLQNNLAVIHPLLILVTYSCLLTLLGVTRLTYISRNVCMFIYILFVTLFLGGWWAFQEFNWGGWWNWDGIETPILLTAALITHIYLHKFALNSHTSIFQLNYSKYLLYSLILIILLPRFGNTNSIHSFISLNTNYIYYISQVLSNSIQFVIFQACILKIHFSTFFFVKVLCLLIIFMWISTIFIKNFSRKAYASHKIIYMIIVLGLSANTKPIVFLSYANWVWCESVPLIYNHFWTNSYAFWVKPKTTSLQDVFQTLNYFLN